MPFKDKIPSMRDHDFILDFLIKKIKRYDTKNWLHTTAKTSNLT